jgi:hypothetical protein
LGHRRRFYGAGFERPATNERGHRRAFFVAWPPASGVFRAPLGRLNLREGKEFSGGTKALKNKTRDPLLESRDSIKTD